MANKTVLQIKEHLRDIWHKRYISFETRKKYQIWITAILLSLFISGVVILFIMGESIYTEEHPKELSYQEDICQVHNTSYREYWCISGRGGGSRCYAPVWDVTYGMNQTINATIVGYNRFRKLPDAIKKIHEYQIGSSYPCWYDTKNALAVQWEQPNSRTGLILMIFGGFTIIATIISSFLLIRLFRQIRNHGRK